MGLTSAIATTAGAGIKAIGAWSEAQGQRTQLGLDAKLADLNAQMKEQQARDTLMAGERQSQAIMMQTAQTKSSQRTALAANGVALDSDSAVNLLSSTDYLGEVDRNTNAANTLRDAMGVRMDAVNYRNQALMDRATRKTISPTMSAVTSLIGSASSVADSWSNPRAQEGLKNAKAGWDKLWAKK